MQAVERTYRTPYGTVHYWVSVLSKQSPWLVFLPGLTADHHLFDKQVEFFADHWNCLTWDAPAHGSSRPFTLKFSMEDMASYLHEIMKAEDVERPILAGQSLGGYLSQAYMDRYPDTVAGFVSIDSSPLSRKYYTKWELAMLKNTKWMYLSIPWKLLIQWGSRGTAESEYGRSLMKQTIESYEKREYCELTGYGFRIVAKAVEDREAYPVSCPVQLICGEKDGAGSVKSYNRRWEKEEGYPICWIPNAGHNSNTDAPELVNQMIEAFGKRIPL